MNASGYRQQSNSFSRILTLGGCLLLLGVLVVTTGCSGQANLDPKSRLTSAPVVDEQAHLLNFEYPSNPPSLKQGKEVFANNCASCHSGGYFKQRKVQNNLLYSTPIDLYIMLNTGEPPVLTNKAKASGIRRQIVFSGNAPHPSYRDSLERDEIWAALFYARYLAGANNIGTAQKKVPDAATVATIYGGNCAVCHGTNGEADGFLYTGHSTSHELMNAGVHGGVFFPAPARFPQYDRMFNRTDAQLFKYIAEGIYPSAMPAWLGNVDQEKGFKFDDELLWALVKHVRSLAMNKAEMKALQGEINPSGLDSSVADRPVLNLQIPPVTPYDPASYAGGQKVESISEFQKIEITGSRMPLQDSGSKQLPEPLKAKPSVDAVEEAGE